MSCFVLEGVRRWIVVGVFATTAALPVVAQGTISGRVVVKDTDLPIGYSVVSLGDKARDQFTDAGGAFTLRNVAAGQVRFIARHIGYVPLDTILVVRSRDTVRVRVELSLVPAQLPAVHSLAKACAHPGTLDPRVGLELATLFEQVKENAERHRLLSRSFPFELDVERKITKPEPMLEARFVAYDTVVRSSERSWRYAPGKMLGTREYSDGVFAGRWATLTMPELADFADEAFLNSHCFDFDGVDVVDGDTLLRIDFVPAPTIRTPDVSGTIYLDRKTYQLRATLLTLVNFNRQLRDALGGQAVRADFREAIPGVPVVHRISSLVFPKEDAKQTPTEPSTETHRTLAIRFLKGRP
jgi:hypothetical protein